MTKQIAIVGAGICGLALAYFLEKEGASCTIFEAASAPGGWLESIEHNGAIFERGPRSLRTTSKELALLLDELGLASEQIAASTSAKVRYIAIDGRLEALPSTFLSLFSTSIGRKLAFALLREPIACRSKEADESVQHFFTRRIGKKATDLFVSSLCAGIYAAQPAELSMRSSFTSMWEAEGQYGSLLLSALFSKKREKIDSFSLRSGIKILPNTLVKRLRGPIYCNNRVHAVYEKGSKVVVEADARYEFDHLFSTVRPNIIRALLPSDDPFQPLLAVPATSVATVSLGYVHESLQMPGFGFLCPQNGENQLLGVVFDSNIFPEQNGIYKTRLSVMMGQEFIDYSDEALLAFSRQQVKKYLNIEALPDVHFITRAANAICRYPVGHYRRVEVLAEDTRPITLLGSGFHGVSVGDAVTAAHNAAQKLYKKIKEPLMFG